MTSRNMKYRWTDTPSGIFKQASVQSKEDALKRPPFYAFTLLPVVLETKDAMILIKGVHVTNLFVYF